MSDLNSVLGLDKLSLEKVLNFLPYPFLVSEVRGGNRYNVFVNNKFLSEIGYSCDDIPTIQDWFEKAYPDVGYREEVIKRWFANAFVAGEKQEDSIVLKARIQTRSFGAQWYEVKAYVSGSFHLVAFVNINEEVLMKEELRRVNENKDHILSILSHDLRTPLASLHSLLQLSTIGALTNQQYSTQVNLLTKNTFLLLEFLDTTLQWTRANYASVKPSIQDFDIRKVLNEIIEIYEPIYSQKGIVVLADDQIETVRGDREIVSIIFRNIFSNAVKFTSGGTIAVGSAREGSRSVITVRDTGAGMTAERIKNIMSDEYKSQEGTRQEKGLGLGLKLCRELLAKVAGEMHIQSAPGTGTTVKIIF